ncbi:MAG: hypothetical protein WBF90_33735 [Rivularia sp. (in: cyanobacteria)]
MTYSQAIEFSATRQADVYKNGEAVKYPQYKTVKYTAYFCDIKTREEKTQNRETRVVTSYRTVTPGQIVGRLHFPKTHSQRTASWFFDKVITIYDSWKSNGYLGWTHFGNPKRVVQFILKPGVDPSIWLEIAKCYVQSNLKAVRLATSDVFETLKQRLESAVNNVKSYVKESVAKVRAPKPAVVETPVVETSTSTLVSVPVTIDPADLRNFCRSLVPQLCLPFGEEVETPVIETEKQQAQKYTEKYYAFVLKYKPSALKRVCNALGFECVDCATLAEDLLAEQIDPKEVKAVFTKRKAK